MTRNEAGHLQPQIMKPEARALPQVTHHASRITHHASRITHHVSRITFHASRFTLHASPHPGTFSRNSFSHTSASESLGARQSPRGESEPPDPTFGPFGMAERLNWLILKKR